MYKSEDGITWVSHENQATNGLTPVVFTSINDIIATYPYGLVTMSGDGVSYTTTETSGTSAWGGGG
jgi:hypothetical protein